jgi:hypothetical protein
MPTCRAHFLQHFDDDTTPNAADTELPKESNTIGVLVFIVKR